MTSAAADVPSSRSALWVLLIGNFIIGTGILLPAGLLNELARDLDVSPATAGLMMLTGGVVVALCAPPVAAFTSRIDRRMLLTFALVLYAAGYAGQALMPSFTPLLIFRALTVLGAAIFTPQAAATAGLLVPQDKRAAAIAFIFIGWSSATVAGIPLGTYLASLIGWREVFGLMALVCALSAVMVWSVLRPCLYVQPLNLTSWRQAFTNPVILTVLLVTMLSMSGQFTAFSYIAPIMKDAFAGGPTEISLAFAVAGVTGVIGNAIASRVVARVGIDQVIAIAIVGLILGLGLFALSFGNLPLALVGIGLWGLGSFSSNSLQQSRLVALAPSLAAATVALNTSVVYVGQAIGAGVGGRLVAKGVSPTLAWTACGFTVAALIASLAATRLGNRARVLPIFSDKA
jgi:MFS transporter, DHA1 family, inner membrane transport protein